jgi:hypothetical protein
VSVIHTSPGPVDAFALGHPYVQLSDFMPLICENIHKRRFVGGDVSDRLFRGFGQHPRSAIVTLCALALKRRSLRYRARRGARRLRPA